jgi:hypothetical protein
MTSVSAPVTAEPAAALLARNLDLFRTHAPRLHAVLGGMERTLSRFDVAANGSVDVIVNGRRLYDGDAVRFTQVQLDTYFDSPSRHFFGEPRPDLIPGLAGDHCTALTSSMARAGIDIVPERRAADAYYTVVFGVGLGLHLPTLVERTDCRCLILVEPIVENIRHSLSVVDWSSIFDASGAQRRSVHFITEFDLEVIASALRTVIRQNGPTQLDGVHVYQHYSLSLLNRAFEQFHRDLHLHAAGLGFFEDELLMTANSVGNLARGVARVIARPTTPHDAPVVMCGSGPSIDGNFERIRNLQDRAIIVSLGSSLRSLLAHGIRPDFHVEMENEIDNANNICKTDDEFGVDGITLLASTTVQPYGAERFDDVVLYFRDRITASHLFGQEFEWLGSCGPTVTNAGLIALLYLGFRRFHFFGVDMGSRDVARYHAADTFIGMGQAREWGSGQRVPVTANFGGTAYAEGVLRWSRLAIETVVRLHRDIVAVNCSDGARIAGVTPMLPHVLDLPERQMDRAALKSRIFRELRTLDPRRDGGAWDRAHEERELGAMIERIEAVLCDAADVAEPDMEWVRKMHGMVLYDAESPAVPAFLYGSVALIIGVLWWYDRRIEDAAQRAAFRRLAIDEMKRSLERARRRLLELFEDIDGVFAGRLAAVVTDPIAPPASKCFDDAELAR